MSQSLAWMMLVFLAAPVRAFQQPLLEFHGTDNSSQLGFAVDGGADVDGDGHDDVLLSAWGDSQQGAGPVYSGTVFICSGADGHVIHAFHGDQAQDHFGVSAAFAGDLDGDGVTDVIVAARGSGSPESYARSFSGTDGHVLFTVHTQTTPGTAPTFEAVDGIGDVDADGHGDVVLAMDRNTSIGTPTDLQVRSGVDGSLLYTIAEVGFTGRPVRGTGDVNADGVGDFAYGDEYHAIKIVFGGSTFNFPVGTVRVYSGLDGSPIHAWDGEGRFDHLGSALDGIGDVDADGHSDIVAGATQTLGYPGYVLIRSGADGNVIHQWKGSASGGDLGSSVARAGDVDGDGYEDLLLGDQLSDFTTDKDGSVRVVSGRDWSLLFEFFGHSGPLSGTSEYCTLGIGGSTVGGSTVASAGDVDADGRSDVIIAAPNDSTLRNNAGSAWVFGGRDFAWHETPSPSIVPPGSPELSGFGALTATRSVAVLLTKAKPTAPCWLIVGFSHAMIPLHHGTLVPAPDVVLGPFIPNQLNGLLLHLAPVPILPPGTTITLQALCGNPQTPGGLVVSNAIESTAN